MDEIGRSDGPEKEPRIGFGLSRDEYLLAIKALGHELGIVIEEAKVITDSAASLRMGRLAKLLTNTARGAIMNSDIFPKNDETYALLIESLEGILPEFNNNEANEAMLVINMIEQFNQARQRAEKYRVRSEQKNDDIFNEIIAASGLTVDGNNATGIVRDAPPVAPNVSKTDPGTSDYERACEIYRRITQPSPNQQTGTASTEEIVENDSLNLRDLYQQTDELTQKVMRNKFGRHLDNLGLYEQVFGRKRTIMARLGFKPRSN